jgi:hypothetical protein
MRGFFPFAYARGQNDKGFWSLKEEQQRQRQQQIPFGDDNKKGKDKDNSNGKSKMTGDTQPSLTGGSGSSRRSRELGNDCFWRMIFSEVKKIKGENDADWDVDRGRGLPGLECSDSGGCS